MSYFPSLYCLRSSNGRAMGVRWPLLLGGGRYTRQVDLVELDRGLVGRLDRGFHAVGFAGGLLEGIGELEAERGERLGIGLLVVAAGERAVDAARELDVDFFRQLDVGLLGVCRRRFRRRIRGGCAHGVSGL